MKKVSKATIKENDSLYDGCVFLEPRDWLDNAITGKCAATGGIIYDAELLVNAYMYRDNLSYDQAKQIVSFNADRMISRMPKPQPIIRYAEEEEEQD